MIGQVLGGLAQLAGQALTALGEALEGGAFDERAAGMFLATEAAAGRMECDGPDAAATISAAGVAAEPRSAPVEPAPQAPGADRWSEPELLLRDSAGFLLMLAPADLSVRAVIDQLIDGLFDLAAQFAADANPLTTSPDRGE